LILDAHRAAEGDQCFDLVRGGEGLAAVEAANPELMAAALGPRGYTTGAFEVGVLEKIEYHRRFPESSMRIAPINGKGMKKVRKRAD
jgi:hypothetical protein